LAYNAMEDIFKKPVTNVESLSSTVFDDNFGDSIFEKEGSAKYYDPMPKEQRDLLNEMSRVLIDLLEGSGKNYNYSVMMKRWGQNRYVIKRHQNETIANTTISSDINNDIPAYSFNFNQSQRPQYFATSDDPTLKSMFEPIMQHLNEFVIDPDVKKLKTGMEEVFDKTSYEKYKPITTHIHDALIYVIRTLFRVLDYLVTFVSRADKLMADTYTPGAQLFVNKNHFFTYSTVSPKPSKKLQEFKEDLFDKVKKLDGLCLS